MPFLKGSWIEQNYPTDISHRVMVSLYWAQTRQNTRIKYSHSSASLQTQNWWFVPYTDWTTPPQSHGLQIDGDRTKGPVHVLEDTTTITEHSVLGLLHKHQWQGCNSNYQVCQIIKSNCYVLAMNVVLQIMVSEVGSCSSQRVVVNPNFKDLCVMYL